MNIDRELMVKFLQSFQNCYAYSLTLKEMLESDEALDYHEIRPKWDRQADQQFALFFRYLNSPEELAKAMQEFLDASSKSGPIQ